MSAQTSAPSCKRCDRVFQPNDPFWLVLSNDTEGDQPEPWDPQMLYRVCPGCLQVGDSLVGSALEDDFWSNQGQVGS